MGRVTSRVRVLKVRYGDPDRRDPRADVVAVEEPLEVRVGGQVLTVTMRTPGADIDLVHGWLLGEGLIRSAEHLRSARYCAGAVATGPDGPGRNSYNLLDLDFAEQAPGRDPATLAAALRSGTTTSACGICGSASIDALRAKLPDDRAPSTQTLPLGSVPGLIATLRTAQATFGATGGTHAAALFDEQLSLRSTAEDVGRHNAVDKVLGACLRAGNQPPFAGVLVVSSRASYEIVQKAAMAGVTVLIAVSAPSSLAVQAAQDLGLSLLAFARDDGVNVYAGAERLRD